MAIKSIDQLKEWFKAKAYPTASQFGDWMDSYWHKDEKIPMTRVDGLPAELNGKYPASQGEALDGRLNDVQQDIHTLEQNLTALDTTVREQGSQMIQEAPQDGKTYGRQDGQWVEIGSAAPVSSTSHIIFNKAISDPANITGDINSGVIAEILAKMRRCLCKYTGPGQMTIRYLNNENSNYYDDGTAAVLTGAEGDVMVYMPEFYYKLEDVDANNRKLSFSHTQPDSTWKKITAGLCGAYKAWKNPVKLGSVSNSTPGIMYYGDLDFLSCAIARGVGYGLIDWQMHCTIAMLFFAKYGTRNAHSILGTGDLWKTSRTGDTNVLGNTDTAGVTTGYTSFQGIEGVVNGLSEWMQGIVGDRANKQITITEPDGSTRIVTLPYYSIYGYVSDITAMGDSDYFDLFPTAIEGSATTHFAILSDFSIEIDPLVRGGYISILIASGIISTASIGSSRFDGTRLAFRGTITEAASVADFKAITITN